VNRRIFVTALAAAPFARAASEIKIGVTDWNLKLASQLEAVRLAASLGFAGVEVSLGRKPVDGKLPLADPAIQDQYLSEAQKRKIALAGTCLDILHVNYLKNDKLGQKWVADGIPITKRLNARVMLLPFFGKGALTSPAEMDHVGDVLRELAPEAAKAGVILGLENTINAADNLRIVERAKSSAVKIYYDCGNLLNNGFDPLKELRAMGVANICQVHLKDNPHYLGEGTIDLAKIVSTLKEMGYRGFANLETNAPSGDIAADMRRNLSYARKLLAESIA
jgi:L-ribulose-5-phosphate 3-epimerase